MDEVKREGLPVAGYRPQTDEAIAIVNNFKRQEELLLRQLDALKELQGPRVGEGPRIDGRWLAIGRTALEQAFMAINRAVFAPSRVKLAEDQEA